MKTLLTTLCAATLALSGLSASAADKEIAVIVKTVNSDFWQNVKKGANDGAAKLKGYTAQVGDANRVLGRSFEFLTQQYVDSVVWAQNEAGTKHVMILKPTSGLLPAPPAEEKAAPSARRKGHP